MIPMIARVWCESGAVWSPTHVPVTPQTTGRDMMDCCREPGDEPCLLFSVHPHHGVHLMRESDLPSEVAAALGPEVQFVLKYVDEQTGSTDKCNGMKEPGSPEELPTETALLIKGGPPVSKGPLALRKPRVDTYVVDEKTSGMHSLISPYNLSGNLLNLRKIEKRAKSTKIHVNPVWHDELVVDEELDKAYAKKEIKSKKKRHKSTDTREDLNNEHPGTSISEARPEKKSVLCFKIKSSPDKSHSEEDPKLGRDNCTNENTSNWKNSVEPDIVIDSRKNTKDDFVEDAAVAKSKESNGARPKKSSVNKADSSTANLQEPKTRKLGEGVELTLGELRAMALRQQQQIDAQHQLLCAKEQRLRYLKQQEARQHQDAMVRSSALWVETLEQLGLVNDIYKAMESQDMADVVMTWLRIIKQYEIQSLQKGSPNLKCEAKSKEYRIKGNQRLALDRYQAALVCYNKALLFAPENSREMVLAYSNRSALFYKLLKFSESLKDIKTCLALGCPDEIIEKLLKRKHDCISQLQEEESFKAMFSSQDCDNYFLICGKRNPQIPCASESVGVIFDEGIPTIVASEAIKVGTVVAVEKAFVTSARRNRYFSCYYCLKMELNLFPCECCSYALFCSQKCKDESCISNWQDFYKTEVAVEGERLRRLRERVEAQELKLRRLRALRGQLDRNKQNNIALTSDLESIRALFNEKEKELSVAVAKVEELTRQLEELRRGRAQPAPPSAHELDKLRRELMYRNKLNEQQNGRLSAQRAALGARQEEMRSIDRRVSELQARLLRKRALNRQLAAAHRHQPRVNSQGPMQQLPYHAGNGQKSQQSRGNVAAVEPYNHVPHAPSLNHAQAMKQNVIQNVPLKQHMQSENMQGQMLQQEAHYLQQKQIMNPLYNGGYQMSPAGHADSQFHGQYINKHPDVNFSHVQQGITNAYDQKSMFDHMNKFQDFSKQPQYSPNSTTSSNSNQGKELKINEQEFLPEFAASKTDPKYQTLPYNTKFSPNTTGKIKPESNKNNADNNHDKNNQNQNGVSVANVNHMTVHSTPLSVVNKSLATPLSQNEVAYQQDQHAYQLQKSESSGRCNQDGKENQTQSRFSQNSSETPKNNAGKNSTNTVALKGSSPILINSSTTTSSSVGFGKPVSSVAPTSVQVSSCKPSPIYQTSSTKIQPVQPQTVQTQSIVQTSSNHVISNPVASQSQIVRNTASGLSTSVGSSYFAGQNASSQSILLSPPQSASTPLSTPDVSGTDKSPKPALPPKPSIKTPPRQSINNDVNLNLGNENDGNIPVTSIPEPTSEGNQVQQTQKETSNGNGSNEMIIKAKPLTIRKPPLSELPKLRNVNNSKNSVSVNMNRRIDMPPAFLFPEMDHLVRDSHASEMQNGMKSKDNTKQKDEVDKALNNNISLNSSENQEKSKDNVVSDIAHQINSVDLNGQDSQSSENILRRSKKGNLKQGGKAPLTRRVSFDPLALLLDASLEGELELVKKTATQVQNASAANDEGITALHNAICAGHIEIVKFLVELGCDVNAQDSDGWTPLHCAASCNNLPMVRFLVDNGACIFATTLSDHETAAEKCEEDEEGFDGCSEYLYSVQEKLGIMNAGSVYSVFGYTAARSDELSFDVGARLQVLRKGDDSEREWWWCRDDAGREGYVPRNLLGLYPRVIQQQE